MNLVIDTNIFISGLIKEGLTRFLILNSQFNLFIPEQELIEIKKHEELISQRSGESIGEIRDLIRFLLKYVTILRNDLLLEHTNKAEVIMEDIDKDDVIFIAAALFLNCSIWSDDKHFQKQKEIKTLTTKDILEMHCKEDEDDNKTQF
jgi:predicted nucleic acid-binding protein